MTKDEALRQELLRMARRDQTARSEAIRDRGAWAEPAPARRLKAIDRRNTAMMVEIVTGHGWPNKKLVGQEGAEAAWLLVQHADDLEFQRRCLALMEEAAGGLVDPAHVAYLADRIRMKEGRPQLYGTQLREEEGRLAPFTIEDEEHVDERRRRVGMPPLADYVRDAGRFYGVGREELNG